MEAARMRQLMQPYLVLSMQRLHKLDNNYINIIKSPKKRTKTPLWELAIDRNKEKEHLGTTSSQIKIKILPASILLGSFIAKSTKQNLILLLVPPKLALTDHDTQSSIFNPESNKDHYMPSFSPNGQFATNN